MYQDENIKNRMVLKEERLRVSKEALKSTKIITKQQIIRLFMNELIKYYQNLLLVIKDQPDRQIVFIKILEKCKDINEQEKIYQECVRFFYIEPI